MQALSGCGASAHTTAYRADHALQRFRSLSSHPSEHHSRRPRVDDHLARPYVECHRQAAPDHATVGSASLGGLIVLTDNDVDDIVAYLKLLGPNRIDK